MPKATFVHVEQDCLRGSCPRGEANLAFSGRRLRINHADVTRSTPGRGRVTHTRFRYSAGETLLISGRLILFGCLHGIQRVLDPSTKRAARMIEDLLEALPEARLRDDWFAEAGFEGP